MTTFQKMLVILGFFVCGAVTWTTVRVGVAAGKPAAAEVERESEGSLMTTTGSAVIRVAPDTATTTVGVSAEKWRAKDAQAELRRKLVKITERLQEAGLAERSISTSQYSLGAHYETVNNRRVFKGYVARSSLALKVQPPEEVGKLLGAAMEAGATTIGDVQFVVDDIKAHRKRARELASKNARDRAQQMAKALGASVGEIRGVDEESGTYYGYYWWDRGSRGRESLGLFQETMTYRPIEAAGPPEEVASEQSGIAPGMVSVTATVRARFALPT